MTNQNTPRLSDLADAARLTRADWRATRTYPADADGTLTLRGVRFTDADAPEATR